MMHQKDKRDIEKGVRNSDDLTVKPMGYSAKEKNLLVLLGGPRGDLPTQKELAMITPRYALFPTMSRGYVDADRILRFWPSATVKSPARIRAVGKSF